MNKVIDEWYKVEYTFTDEGSNAIIYNGSREINTRKGAEQFAALIIHLADTHYLQYTDKQRRLSIKLLGKGKTIKELKHFYKYVKIEIEIKG